MSGEVKSQAACDALWKQRKRDVLLYWSDWIGRHHRQRRKLLAQTGLGATVALVALGFTSVYREGFESVLFLQNLQLKAGSTAVLEGVAVGLAATAVVCAATFWLQRKLPYRRMLIAIGVLVGLVLPVMIGGTALSFEDLGWLPRHPTPPHRATWMGAWFEMYSSWETLGAQVLAAVFVVGSYYLAECLKAGRRQARGEAPVARATEPPAVLLDPNAGAGQAPPCRLQAGSDR